MLSRRKGDPAKVELALRLRQETSVSLKWIANRLRMGSWTYVSLLINELKNPKPTSSANLLPSKPGADTKMALRAFFVLDPLQSASFRAIEAIGSLRSSRRNASVSEHFTLNKSRISCAKHPKQLTRGRGLRNPGPE